jgi:hypothetical protein
MVRAEPEKNKMIARYKFNLPEEAADVFKGPHWPVSGRITNILCLSTRSIIYILSMTYTIFVYQKRTQNVPFSILRFF